jgi:glycerol-3-phosphate acyltransferase PlsX
MGSAYAKKTMKLPAPRVGLLNNGTEEAKGDALRREAYKLLRCAGDEGRLCFAGNVEGRDIAFGAADVVVADGFSGNIMLKTAEGMGLFFADLMKKVFTKSLVTKLGALCVRGGLKSFKKLLDYTEYGGAPFLGVSRPVIKAHGSSNAKAVASAVRQARDFARSGVTAKIAENIEYMKV